MGHAELVLDHQQAMQERLQFEVEGGIDVVTAAVKSPCPPVEDATEGLKSGVSTDSATSLGIEELLLMIIGNKPLPELIVALEVFFTSNAVQSPIVPPRISTEQL